MTKQEIELLKIIKSYMEPSFMVNAIYRTPAQCLRIEADMIEKKERDIVLFGELIKKYDT
jgi:hypothetical protein